MERVDKVFNLNAYRDWAKRTYGSGSVPDWARACNGRQAYLENGQTLWVIGLDGEYYRCHIECLTPPASGRQFVTGGGVIEIAATVLERNAKVEKNAGLVYYLVLKNNNGVPDDDLAQEGFVALIKAVERFDPERGVQFATYAARYIDGYIKTYKNLNRTIKPSRIGDSGSFRYANVVSLNMPVDSADGSELGNIIGDDTRFEEGIDDASVLDGFLSTLQDRDRQIFRMSLKGKKQWEIAENTGISQSYVSRLMRRLIKKYAFYAGIGGRNERANHRVIV